MSNRMKTSRREFLRATALVMGGAVLAACTPPASPSAPAAPAQEATKPAAQPAAAGPVTVRIVVWGDVTDKQVYDNITADFLKVEPNITPAPEQYPGGYYEKIQA